eukprot:3611566-Alexandrium_andersonii.AAC.1
MRCARALAGACPDATKPAAPQYAHAALPVDAITSGRHPHTAVVSSEHRRKRGQKSTRNPRARSS